MQHVWTCINEKWSGLSQACPYASILLCALLCVCRVLGCAVRYLLGLYPHFHVCDAGMRALMERRSLWVLCLHPTARVGTPCSICISICFLVVTDTLQRESCKVCAKLASLSALLYSPVLTPWCVCVFLRPLKWCCDANLNAYGTSWCATWQVFSVH